MKSFREPWSESEKLNVIFCLFHSNYVLKHENSPEGKVLHCRVYVNLAKDFCCGRLPALSVCGSDTSARLGDLWSNAVLQKPVRSGGEIFGAGEETVTGGWIFINFKNKKKM